MCNVFEIEYEPYIGLPLLLPFYSLSLSLSPARFCECRFIPYRITIFKHVSRHKNVHTKYATYCEWEREGKGTTHTLTLPRNTRPSYGFQLFSNMSHFNLNQSFYGMTEWHLSMSPCFEFNFLCILNVIRSKCKFSPAFSIHCMCLCVCILGVIHLPRYNVYFDRARARARALTQCDIAPKKYIYTFYILYNCHFTIK